MSEQMVSDTRARARTIEHAWDSRALDWPLTKDSVVVEVGGYQGRWALQIAERFHPRLFVFEPQPWAAAVARAVLGDMATVREYGLGDHDATMQMGYWGTDGCSLVHGRSGDLAPARIREIGQSFREMEIDQVDLMLMNIEGYEYILLPHMLDVGIHPARLMVQFHTFADPDGRKRDAITQRLGHLGYRVAWEYWALTAWERD